MNLLIFPNQLFKINGVPAKQKEIKKIYLVEHPVFFSKYNFHYLKRVLHRASMKSYEDYLASLFGKNKVKYIEHNEAKSFMKKIDKNTIFMETHDHEIDEELSKIKKNEVQSPYFINSKKDIAEYIEYCQKRKLKPFFHSNFYKYQRQKREILMEKGKPKGGKYTYDSENRLAIPDKMKVPEVPSFAGKYIVEAQKYVKKTFPKALYTTWHEKHPSKFIFPIDHTGARTLLHQFFKKKFAQFGPYQDAITPRTSYGFHSMLSSSINLGLITPKEVVEEAIKYSKNKKIPLQSVEGFIRQIIGWREYMRMIYMFDKSAKEQNKFFSKFKPYFNNHIKITSDNFYYGETGINIFDHFIKNGVINTAYAHHIIRLMVFGAFFLMLGIDLQFIYSWFMECFIDAYDWVMWGNVINMSQFAGGGRATTKPYFSASSYLKKMGYKMSTEDSNKWDTIYYSFINKHQSKLKKSYRAASMVKHWTNKSTTEKKHITEKAKNIIKALLE